MTVHHDYDDPTQLLTSRHHFVSELTAKYYKGDVIPPSTKSQILRAQKFSVMYHYAITALVFVYGLCIPLMLPDDPNFGGLNYRDMHPHAVILIGIVCLLPMLRFGIMTWDAEFYQFGVLLAIFEVIVFTFVCVWWSVGLPALVSIFVSNLLNVAVSQVYWRRRLSEIVLSLLELTPPNPLEFHHRDRTSVKIWPSLGELAHEWYSLMGFAKTKTVEDIYDERCGVFGQKEGQMSHSKAMQLAYQQALFPFEEITPWEKTDLEMWSLRCFGLLDGLLTVFVSNVVYAFAGVWMGKALFVNWYHGGYALVAGGILISMFGMSLRRTLGCLEEGLGVAVAEKEWLAYDVVRHQGDRSDMMHDVLDLDLNVSAQMATGGKHRADHHQITAADLDLMDRGRLNLVHMWLCVASVADFIGESHLAQGYWNLAIQSRYMIEAVTNFEFKLYHHSKWEVSHKGTVLRIMETLMLSVMCSLYFGSFFPNGTVPVPLAATLSAACFISSVLRLIEAVQYAFTILGSARKVMQRHTYVSEWIVLMAVIFVLINIVIWLYLLPIMKGWNLPIGKCKAVFNKVLFPTACAKWTATP